MLINKEKRSYLVNTAIVRGEGTHIYRVVVCFHSDNVLKFVVVIGLHRLLTGRLTHSGNLVLVVAAKKGVAVGL